MGENNKDSSQDTSQSGGNSGNDPRGRLQNQSNYQQNRFESQQGPLANAMAMNYGRGSEADYGNYTDIMNQYRNVASGQGAGAIQPTAGYASGAYGGPGYSAFTVNPGSVTAGTASAGPDPFNSYAKYQGLSDTGGYSAQDMADLRARGTAPVRAAYANAQDNINRQRSLQGGYSPNAIAAQTKMAREQGQSMADAMQNTNAGIIAARNQGQLAGMQGMSGIEGQRYGMAGDLSKFNVGNDLAAQQYNTGLNYQGQTYNADAQARAQAGNISIGQSNAAANASAQNQGAAAANAAASAAAARQMQALGGMTSLYGTTPGMSSTFGNQALGAVNSGGNFGNQLYQNDIMAQKAPGAYDQTLGRVQQGVNTATQVANPLYNYFSNRQQQPQVGNGSDTSINGTPYGMNTDYPAYNPNDYSDQYYGDGG